MPKFTQPEIDMLNDAIEMARSSNRRMQVSKPKFQQVFSQIEIDLAALKHKVNTPEK